MFRFKLQPILDFREVGERRAMQVYAGKVRQWEAETALLEGLRERKSLLLRRFGEMQKRETNSAEVASLFSFLERIKGEETAQEGRVSRAKEEVEEKRRELLEAVKKRKAIELLKEKRAEEYRREQNRKEREGLDEFGIDHYRREEGEEADRGL